MLRSLVGSEMCIRDRYLSAEISTDYSNQQLSTRNPEYLDLLEERKRTENGASSTSYNFGIGKKFKSGLIIESGINFDRIRTRFQLSDQDLISNSTVITIDTIITPSGPVVVIDTSFQQVAGAEINSRNVFNQINVPILLGYELPINEKFSIIGKGGIQLNMNSSNNGQILSPNGPMIYSSDNLEESHYKTNLGLSYIGSLDIATQLTTDIAIYSGLNISYYPDDISLSSYPIKETYVKYGLNIGMRYKL